MEIQIPFESLVFYNCSEKTPPTIDEKKQTYDLILKTLEEYAQILSQLNAIPRSKTRTSSRYHSWCNDDTPIFQITADDLVVNVEPYEKNFLFRYKSAEISDIKLQTLDTRINLSIQKGRVYFHIDGIDGCIEAETDTLMKPGCSIADKVGRVLPYRIKSLLTQ